MKKREIAEERVKTEVSILLSSLDLLKFGTYNSGYCHRIFLWKKQ
jgi:hypothetical protein